MKEGIRVLGIDDAPSERTDEQTFLTGVVYRGYRVYRRYPDRKYPGRWRGRDKESFESIP